MAKPTDFPGTNLLLVGPAGRDDVSPMHVFTNGMFCVSCWELTDEEIAEITRARKVFLCVMSGGNQPPVYVGTEDAVRGLIADVGVWKR